MRTSSYTWSAQRILRLQLGHPMRFAHGIGKLTEEQRLHFYEILAHNLTVSIRGIWSDEQIDATLKKESSG